MIHDKTLENTKETSIDVNGQEHNLAWVISNLPAITQGGSHWAWLLLWLGLHAQSNEWNWCWDLMPYPVNPPLLQNHFILNNTGGACGKKSPSRMHEAVLRKTEYSVKATTTKVSRMICSVPLPMNEYSIEKWKNIKIWG
jgi:hypothetical protein